MKKILPVLIFYRDSCGICCLVYRYPKKGDPVFINA